MKKLKFGSFFLILVTMLSGIALGAGNDDYYLKRFDELYGSRAQTAGAIAVREGGVQERCLTPLYHGLKRDWEQLAPQTQKALAKYLARPTLSGEQDNIHTSAQGHFNIHYSTVAPDAPPLTDANNNGVPDWVETVGSVFESVYSTEVTGMGYAAAPTAGGASYDVYLQSLGSTRRFGETVSDEPVPQSSVSFTSFITIDNDFADSVYAPYTAEKGLQITAAHEYHHAIQFGYNFYFESWYAEATSTWIEDENYDQVNQLYTYLFNYMTKTTSSIDIPPDVSTGGGYGRWIFNRFLAERFTPGIIKNIWVRLGTTPPPSNRNSEISMLPIVNAELNNNGRNLGDEFFAFTKKLYLRDWTSHTQEVGLIHPVVSVAIYNTYPINTATSPAPSVTLPHYAFAYYTFQPSSSAPADLVLSIAKASGINAVAFKKSTGGVISEYQLDSASGKLTIPAFNAADTVEAVLLLCNNSATDGQTANFSTDGSISSPPATSNGGSSSGCFIATAAYGSYLHPKVVILREFRDEYLMTNMPGRAFVAQYYRISPPLADFVAKHDQLRAFCQIVLAPLVLAVEYIRVAFIVCFVILTIVTWRCCKRLLPTGKFKAGKKM